VTLFVKSLVDGRTVHIQTPIDEEKS
jgi:hypothetical protein